MSIFAIDPGTIQSALVILDHYPGRLIVRHSETSLNGAILESLRKEPTVASDVLVIEQIESMGMAVGQETFTTVWWAGRFYEAWRHAHRYQLPRRPIKLHLCGNMRATDSNIRAALIDKFGGATAVGKKATPGPLFGIKGHEYAALAVAVTWAETHATNSVGPEVAR